MAARGQRGALNPVVSRIQQYGNRNNTRNSFSVRSISRTHAREIIQGVVKFSSLLSQDLPPVERAPGAVEETPAEDHGATVSFSARGPMTSARVAS